MAANTIIKPWRYNRAKDVERHTKEVVREERLPPEIISLLDAMARRFESLEATLAAAAARIDSLDKQQLDTMTALQAVLQHIADQGGTISYILQNAQDVRGGKVGHGAK
jgi:ABC-type transporter Mla subunit MlaD